ncbi:MAG: hypothetical protein N2482_01070 [Patescibacteria group bacterium]|nr:hypothetical protein [Patescibacteria group bacterium]
MQKQINVGNQNTQQIGQNQIDQPVTIEKKPKVNYWMMATIILSVLIVISTTTFLVKNQQNKNTDNIGKSEQSTSLISIKPGYKAYTNKVYGFSFEYPENFIFEPDISSSSPETSMIVMLEEYKLFKDVSPSEKHTSVVIGYTEGVNQETCKTNSDSFNGFNRFSKADPAKYKVKKITSSFLGSQIDGLFVQEKIITDNPSYKEGFRTRFETVYPLCVNNKFFEIRFQYSGFTNDETTEVEQDKFKTDLLNSFKLLNKNELESTKTENKLSAEEQEILNRFNTEVLPANLSIEKELINKQISQIFKLGEIYAIRTEPKGFIQGMTYKDEGAINIYLVDKSSFVTLVKADHDIVHIAKLYSPKGLETKRMIVQLGGGAHVSNLYLLDITSGIRVIKLRDQKNYSAKVSEITEIPFINIREDGSIHAEQFEFKDNTMNCFQMDVSGNWGVYLTIDLLSGELTKMRIEKNPLLGGNSNPNGKTEIVFDN